MVGRRWLRLLTDEYADTHADADLSVGEHNYVYIYWHLSSREPTSGIRRSSYEPGRIYSGGGGELTGHFRVLRTSGLICLPWRSSMSLILATLRS